MSKWEEDRLPSPHILRREVSKFLRSSDDPRTLTFKQVRFAVEKSLGLPEGTLISKIKSRFKEAINFVMDEIEAEGNAVTSPPREVEPKDAVSTSKTHRTEVDSKPSKRKKNESGDSTSRMKKARGKTREPRRADKIISKPKGSTTGSCRGGHSDRDGRHKDRSLVCVLSETARSRRQVNVKKWKGNIQVDVREYYAKDNGEYAPSKKGITLNPSQWDIIRIAMNDIDAMVEAKR